MTVDIIARAEARIAHLADQADMFDRAAKTLQGRATDCRLGIIELEQFLTMARELAEDDEPRPVDVQAGLWPPAVVVTPTAAESVTAEEVTDPTSSAPHSPDGASEEVGGFSVAAAPHDSGATEGDEGDQTSQHVNVGETSDATAGETAPISEIPAAQPESEVVAFSPEITPESALDEMRRFVGTLDDGSGDEKADAPPPAGGEGTASPAPSSAEAPTDETGIASSSESSRPAPPLALADKIIAALADDPTLTAKQLGEKLGVTPQRINSAAARREIAIPRVVVSRVAPPSPPPPVAPPVADDSEADFVPPAASSTQPFQVKRPKGQLFWLRDRDGQYLNRFCSKMTKNRKEAWTGNEAQVAGCRRSYLIARDLRDQPVEKEKAPV